MAEHKQCPECFEAVLLEARRCPHCRADLNKSEFQRKAERLGKDLQGCGCAMLILGIVLGTGLVLFT